MDASTEQLVQKLRAERNQLLQQIVAANADIDQRIRELGVTVCYDREDDVLLISIGAHTEAITESIEPGRLARLDPETLKIVGLEVLGFVAQIARDPGLFDLFLDAVQTVNANILVEPHTAHRDPGDRLARRLQDMIAA